MSRYLLSRKQLDVEVCNWEKSRLKNPISLQLYIRNSQAKYMSERLLEDGVDSVKLAELRKELADTTDNSS